MKLNFRNQLAICLEALFLSLLTSCATVTPSPTLAPSQPASTTSATAENSSTLLEAGRYYADPPDDMPISFLDVVGFQAVVNEEAETLEVRLQMRDIPKDALRGQVINLFEYFWLLYIYLDPSKTYPADLPGDYYFGLNTEMLEPPRLGGDGVRTPIPGTPVKVPINQLFEKKYVYDSSTGESVSALNVAADPDTDVIVLTGNVPGIKLEARFSFDMTYYDGTKDRPDNVSSSKMVHLPTPLPFATQPSVSSVPTLAVDKTTQLIPVENVRAYPGPEHYAGDVLTFEIQSDGSFGDETLEVSIALDDNPPTDVSATSSFVNVLLPLALDTKNLSGQHTVKFTTPDGRLNETYTFEVLPAGERPANEETAAWTSREINCCRLHYISETAAARDIEFIREHFEQATEEFRMITGTTIDPKLDVYILDRIWGNGGFGGGGELVISYTDRYYGPTVGGEGLETLARHEFSHAADLAVASIGDGIDFNYEGLAVYIAGGHYKPEPLPQRGAALYDLGHYVPVGQFLQQHELAYLYPAALLAYIDERYGEDKLWEFFGADANTSDGQPLPLGDAIQSTFGISLNEFNQDFQDWLASNDPGEQLDDLRLTIELQDLRRQYQDTYAPPPYFLLARAEDAVARPEYVPVVMREARAAPNMAVELIIAHAQKAIIDGDYLRAEELITILKEIVSTGRFEVPLAKEYLDLVLALEKAGYETVSLNFQRDQATAGATREPPLVTSVELEKINGIWQVKP